LPGGSSLPAGDPGRGQSVKCKIARKQAPTKNRCASHLEQSVLSGAGPDVPAQRQV